MSLGISLVQTRLAIGIVASLLAGSAVSVAGLIGFIGLIVPHGIGRCQTVFGNLPQEQLGWFDECNVRYLTMDELANSERQRADVAQVQVDLERQRADAAQAQVDELLMRLKSIEEDR